MSTTQYTFPYCRQEKRRRVVGEFDFSGALVLLLRQTRKIAAFRITLTYIDLHGRLYRVYEDIIASKPHCVGGYRLNDGLTVIFWHVSASWLVPRLWG